MALNANICLNHEPTGIGHKGCAVAVEGVGRLTLMNIFCWSFYGRTALRT